MGQNRSKDVILKYFYTIIYNKSHTVQEGTEIPSDIVFDA